MGPIVISPSVRRELAAWAHDAAATATAATGVRYVAVDDAPSSYGAMLDAWQIALEVSSVFPVFAGGSADTVYGRPEANHAFRFAHDWAHYLLGLSFTLDHERLVARSHVGSLARYGASADAAAVLWADTYGQSLYAERYGRFPTNQLEFVSAFVTCPTLALEREF